MSKNKTIKVLVYQAEGEKREEEINSDNLLKSLQKLVNGYIQIAVSSEDYYLLCNEDGLIKQLPINIHYPSLVGDVVWIRKEDMQ